MFNATQPDIPVETKKQAELYLIAKGFSVICGHWLKGHSLGARIRKTPAGRFKITIGKHVW